MSIGRRSSGRDPEETRALIAILVYLAILHAHFAGWIRDFGLAVGSILGGPAMVMAWVKGLA